MFIQRLARVGPVIHLHLVLFLLLRQAVEASNASTTNFHLATPTLPSVPILQSSMVVTDTIEAPTDADIWPGKQQDPGQPGKQQDPGHPGKQQDPGQPGKQQDPDQSSWLSASSRAMDDTWTASLAVNTFHSTPTPSQTDSSAAYDPHLNSQSSPVNGEATENREDAPLPRRAHPSSTFEHGSVERHHEEEEEGGFPADVGGLGSGIPAPDVARANRRVDVVMPHWPRVEEAEGVVTTSDNASVDDQNGVADNSTRDLLNASSPVQVDHPAPADQEANPRHLTSVVLPTALGISVLLLLITGAAVYRWRLRGRRRKVYFGGGPHGTTATAAKDFAEDRGVRGPVLLPDEIEMQVARSSLRARKALVLTSEVASVGDGTTTDEDWSERTLDCTPPPPPYRSPPPYLPDVIIQNVHAT